MKIGVNDADYKVNLYKTSEGKSVKIWMCPIYSKWKHMLTRCYDDKYKQSRPTYHNISCCEEWLTFSNFRSWVTSFNLSDDHLSKLVLDKDLLQKGPNKIYSPKTCVLLPYYINDSLKVSKGSRGNLPIGVSLEDQKVYKKPYKSSIRKFGKLKNLGRYHTPKEAHEAWQKSKIGYFKDILCKYKTEDIIFPEVISAIGNIITNLELELKLKEETHGFYSKLL